MHSPQHARYEFVYAIALLNEWHQCRNPTLIVGAMSEMRKYKFLEGIDLILEGHKVCDCFITVRLLENKEVERKNFLGRGSYPSFGSFIVLRLIYSSYSNRPGC